MSAGRKLVCVAPSRPPQCQVIDFKVPSPSHGEVLVKVEATSVNPIDVKRASGYGQRLLKLKGAGRFPLTVGNDVAGVVMSTGGGVSGWKAGDRVFGLVPTGPQGAHASHVLVKARHLRASPACYSPSELATLPYTFTTLWLALRGGSLRVADLLIARPDVDVEARNAQAVAAMTPDERVLLERLQGIHKANAEETLRSLFGAPVFEDEGSKMWSVTAADRSSTLGLLERWGALTLLWQANGRFIYARRL